MGMKTFGLLAAMMMIHEPPKRIVCAPLNPIADAAKKEKGYRRRGDRNQRQRRKYLRQNPHMRKYQKH